MDSVEYCLDNKKAHIWFKCTLKWYGLCNLKWHYSYLYLACMTIFYMNKFFREVGKKSGAVVIKKYRGSHKKEEIKKLMHVMNK